MYIVFIIAILVKQSESLREVITCPLGKRGWQIREKHFNCKVADGFTYHCLLDYHENPVEVCLQRKKYEKGGCPWVLESGGRHFLGKPLTTCKHIKYCPGGGIHFYSNQLYEYPACFEKKGERDNFTLPKGFDVISSVGTEARKPSDESTNVYKVLFFFLLSINISILICLIIRINIKHRKRKRSKHNESFKSITEGYRRHTWDLTNLIRKEDDPEKANDIYNLFEKMEEREYEAQLPKVDDTHVSFLIFAALKDRKKIVLRLLNRYLEGSHVFSHDTYGVDLNNENIMHLAIQKGWADVVEKLLEVDDNYFNNDDVFQLAVLLRKTEIQNILKGYGATGKYEFDSED